MPPDNKPTMYEEGLSYLRTGDIVALDPDFFKNHIKNKSAVELFSDFSGQEKYTDLWCLLNKSCDLSETNSSKLMVNLVLVPLIKFSHAVFDDLVSGITNNKTPKFSSHFMEAFRNYSWRRIHEANKNLSKKEFEADFQDVRSSLLETISELKKRPHTEEELFKTISQVYNQPDSINDFKSSSEWQDELKKHKEDVESFEREKTKIKIASGDRFRRVINNQTDGEGFFFFEPHPNLKKSDEICFIIKFDEVMFLKVNHERASKVLSHLRTERRKVSLTEGFSARLQNMYADFVGKVGTDDIKASDIEAQLKKEVPQYWIS